MLIANPFNLMPSPSQVIAITTTNFPATGGPRTGQLVERAFSLFPKQSDRSA